MDEEIFVDKGNNIEYLKRLVLQNTFLMILIVIVVVSALSFFGNVYINDSFLCAIIERNPIVIKAFNNKFKIYDGTQTGAKLKSMIGTVIDNTNTYKPIVIVKNDENEIEIQAYCIKESSINGIIEGSLEFYTNNLSLIRNKLIDENDYIVEFDYAENGLINSIIITGILKSLDEGK